MKESEVQLANDDNDAHLEQLPGFIDPFENLRNLFLLVLMICDFPKSRLLVELG